MVGRSVWVVILIAAVVLTAVAGVLIGINLTPPPPPPPLEDGGALQFAVTQPIFRLGENVTFALRNRLDHMVCMPSPSPWLVERLMEGEWRTVSSHGDAAVYSGLGPGETRTWTWKAETPTYKPVPDFPDVEPGEYRVTLTVILECYSYPGGYSTLSTFFRLVE